MSRLRISFTCCCLIVLAVSLPAPVASFPAQVSLISEMLPLNPDWHFEVNQAADISVLDHRQLNVAAGCDVNGDGYGDVLIGDRDFDYQYARDDNGRAWLFYGSPTGLEATPAHTFDPPYLNYYGFFGAAVACNLDVNADGFDDMLIGMDNYDSAYPDEGAVFLWYGSASGPAAGYAWMAHGNATYAHFGFTLDSGGDVNGDGYDDVFVGAFRYDDNQVAHAYLWYGSATGLGANGTPANADWVASAAYPGQTNGIGFGRLVRGIGDVNGDGYDDLLVGAPFYANGLTRQGAAYVWYGSASGPGENGTLANADWWAASGQADARLATTGVDGVGDLNQDGCDDLAISAYAYDDPETSEGSIFVWYGSFAGLGETGSPANADWNAQANATAYLGYSLRSAGDVNGDGYSDLLAGAPVLTVDPAGAALAGAGAWFVWLGGPAGLGDPGDPLTADLAGYGDQTQGRLGMDDVASGDVNGDGFSDLLASAYLYDLGQTDEGVVFGYLSPFTRLYIPVITRAAP